MTVLARGISVMKYKRQNTVRCAGIFVGCLLLSTLGAVDSAGAQFSQRQTSPTARILPCEGSGIEESILSLARKTASEGKNNLYYHALDRRFNETRDPRVRVQIGNPPSTFFANTSTCQGMALAIPEIKAACQAFSQDVTAIMKDSEFSLADIQTGPTDFPAGPDGVTYQRRLCKVELVISLNDGSADQEDILYYVVFTSNNQLQVTINQPQNGM
jgi:hypothetical protein